MATEVHVKTSGTTFGDGSVLANAASEDTLKDILKQIKLLINGQKAMHDHSKAVAPGTTQYHDAMTKVNKEAVKSLPGHATGMMGVASDKIGTLGDEAEGLGKLLDTAVTPSFMRTAVQLGGLAEVAKVAQSVFTAFEYASKGVLSLLMSGKTTSASDFFNAITKPIESIPLLGSVMAPFIDVIGGGLQQITSWTRDLYALNKTGAAFGNNLMEMVGAAAHAGMGLEEFAGIVRANSPTLAKLGGTVTEGALKFAQISNISLNEFGTKLGEMGISMDDYNQELPKILGLYTMGDLTRASSNKQMSDSAVGLITELDLLAKLTGKSREDQEAALAKQEDNAAIELAKSHMTKDQIDQMNIAVAVANARGGEMAGRSVLLGIAGIRSMEPAMIKYQALYQKNADTSLGWGNAIRQGLVGSTADMKSHMDEFGANLVVEGNKSSEAFGLYATAALAGVPGMSDFAEVIKSNIDVQGQYMGQSLEQVMQTTARGKAEQQNSDDAMKGMAAFNTAVREMQEDLFSKLIYPLANQYGPLLQKLLPQIIDAMQKIIVGVANVLGLVLDHPKMAAWATGSLGGAAIGTVFGSMFGGPPGAVIGALIGGAVGGVGSAVGASEMGFAGGTPSAGNILKDFGTETHTTLHGREAVLTEAQLTNLAKGLSAGGAQSGNTKEHTELLSKAVMHLGNLNELFQKNLRVNEATLRAVV